MQNLIANNTFSAFVASRGCVIVCRTFILHTISPILLNTKGIHFLKRVNKSCNTLTQTKISIHLRYVIKIHNTLTSLIFQAVRNKS